MTYFIYVVWIYFTVRLIDTMAMYFFLSEVELDEIYNTKGYTRPISVLHLLYSFVILAIASYKV